MNYATAKNIMSGQSIRSLVQSTALPKKEEKLLWQKLEEIEERKNLDLNDPFEGVFFDDHQEFFSPRETIQLAKVVK